jgi:uncharacterized membrane protein
VIDLGGLPGSTFSVALGVNDAGQVVGYSVGSPIPEPSTWAMMLVGLAGLAFGSYRRAKAGGVTLANPLSDRIAAGGLVIPPQGGIQSLGKVLAQCPRGRTNSDQTIRPHGLISNRYNHA